MSYKDGGWADEGSSDHVLATTISDRLTSEAKCCQRRNEDWNVQLLTFLALHISPTSNSFFFRLPFFTDPSPLTSLTANVFSISHTDTSTSLPARAKLDDWEEDDPMQVIGDDTVRFWIFDGPA